MAPDSDILTITHKIAESRNVSESQIVSRQDMEQGAGIHRLFYEWHGQDLRIKETAKCPTIGANMGMGGAVRLLPC